MTQANFPSAAFEATSYAVMISDAEGTIVSVNPAFTEVTGWTAEEAVGQTPRILSSGRQDADFYEAMWRALKTGGHWEGELWNRRKSGEVYPEHLTIDAVHGPDGAITHYVAVFSDIENRKLRERRLSYLAFHDELTSLPNRTLFMDRLERAVAMARRRGTQLAVLMLDLDGFKDVNDKFGHEAGDLLLKGVAGRLKACLRDADTLSRLGGDEFAVLLPMIDGAASAREVASRLLVLLRRPFLMAGDELSVSASIGVALFPGDGESPEEIMNCADQAMYGVKRAGKGGFAMYGEFEPPAQRRRRAV
jgi:diguanylate cyclase (GGDEF)-like protein/PAS domain S-box-containing protein